MTMLEKIKTLNIPLPEDIQKAKDFGDFTRANRLIDQYLDDEMTPEFMKDRLFTEKEVIKRLQIAYPYTEEEALHLIQTEIKDFTMEELHHYEDIHAADWIYINGEVHLQDRFFASMKKVYAEIAERAGNPLSSTNPLLDTNMEDMEENGGAAYHIRLKTTIRINEDSFQPGNVLVQIPVPASCQNMKNIHILSTSHPDYILADENAPMRTIAFQKECEENETFSVEYEYDSVVPYQELQIKGASVPKEFDFLNEEESQIVFTPAIKALCKELIGHETNPLIQAWRFYEYCTENVTYAFMREYMTLENICEYATTQRIGDCGVKALLFITLCRCAGIPAHWQSGMYVTPDYTGNHDWAMFYIEPFGWLFADPSFGGSAYRNGNMERHAFYFGHLDPFRMAANNDFQKEFTPVKKWWRHDPYDNQSGEVEYDDHGLLGHEFTCEKELITFEKTDYSKFQ